VDIIVDGGDINESMGSTIIEMDKNDMKLIREGDIKEKEITVFLNGRN
jgi:tRNA A37 threonylcarbamoyladenosine synthetase subunit TsaC/SUA5/YrdC